MSGDVLIGSFGAATLARRLAAVPAGARRSTAKALRRTAEEVKVDAASNASWSSRIPDSLVVQVRFAGRYPGAVIIARASIAPHARPYEGIGGNAYFKHPLFGNRDKLQLQATRPFLRPAVLQAGSELPDRLAAAVDEAVKATGL